MIYINNKESRIEGSLKDVSIECEYLLRRIFDKVCATYGDSEVAKGRLLTILMDSFDRNSSDMEWIENKEEILSYTE